MALVKYRTNGLNKGFNTFFDEFFNKDINHFVGNDSIKKMPSVNIIENDRGFTIEVAAPGFNKEDFNAQVDDNVLTISAEVKQENAEKAHYNRREFHYASFNRSFNLPDNVQANKISASYNNGILSVNIPKTKEPDKLVKKVKIE